MSTVVSKNLFEILGNTHDEDSDKEPEPPVKVIDKTPARTTKRNAPAEAPASKASGPSEGRGGRHGGYSGNEGAFRDRNAGSAYNRGKSIEERGQATYEARGRGRGGPRNFDRHSRGVGGDSEKQAAHGWGAIDGGAELADEKAGDALADAEKKDTDGDVSAEPAVELEPEDNSISYADYLIKQQEKKAALAAKTPELRKPNEGSKQDKIWANAKPIAKDNEEDFVTGAGGKARRERERKQKQVVEIDQRFVENPDRGGRGGGFRGGRGRGEFRGRGEGGRGGRGRGDGSHRAGRPRDSSGPSTPIDTDDTSAFPSLGS